MENLKTIDECKLSIQEFANKHKIIFEDDGECGFDRKCVGLSNDGQYIDYNPIDKVNYDYLEEFYDERFYNIAPPDAYHKYNCIAVLGSGDDAIRQLSDWVDALNEIGIKFEKYPTGATGLQSVISGMFGKAVRVA